MPYKCDSSYYSAPRISQKNNMHNAPSLLSSVTIRDGVKWNINGVNTAYEYQLFCVSVLPSPPTYHTSFIMVRGCWSCAKLSSCDATSYCICAVVYSSYSQLPDIPGDYLFSPELHDALCCGDKGSCYHYSVNLQLWTIFAWLITWVFCTFSFH
jgi:hypothetical protein